MKNLEHHLLASHGEWAHLSLRIAGAPDVTRFSGIAQIDNREIGYLVGDQPRTFRVAPGKHKVSVFLWEIARIYGYPGRKAEDLELIVNPGDQISLVCRCKEPAASDWARFNRRMMFRLRLWSGIWVAFLGLGCVFSAQIRELGSWVIIRFELEIGATRWWNDKTRTPFLISVIVASLCCFPGMAYLSIWGLRTARRLWLEHGNLFEIKRENPPDAPHDGVA